ITTDTVVAVEAGAFVAAFQPVPEISASTEAAIHQENTTPLPIVDGASTPAPNTRSLWQTDCIALRTILRGNWGARGDLVAKIDSVNW
ncbi:MAG: phage major capsid protein, partial [Methyloceanibacter sp.]